MNLKEKIQGLLIAIIFILALSFCSIVETTYTQNATVIQIKDDIALIETKDGYVWNFNARGLSLGDEVRLVMDNNHTYSIVSDDRVKRVKKIK